MSYLLQALPMGEIHLLRFQNPIFCMEINFLYKQPIFVDGLLTGQTAISRYQKSSSLIISSSTEPHQEFLIPVIGFAQYWISVKFSSKERKKKRLKEGGRLYQDYKVGGGAADSKRRSFNFFSPCHQLSICRISHEMLRLSVTLYI